MYHVIAILMLVILSVTDIKKRKIPNKVTFPCMALGIVLSAMHGGNIVWILWTLLAFFLLGTFYVLSMGDVKMMMAVVLISNPVHGISTFIASQIILASVHFIYRKKLALGEISTRTYPLASFVLMGYLMSFLWL